jgi:glycosyltransferase involved in cell wall biosynthesis
MSGRAVAKSGSGHPAYSLVRAIGLYSLYAVISVHCILGTLRNQQFRREKMRLLLQRLFGARPTRRRSITWITPNQDMTSGGVFAIHQIAVELGRMIDVNLIVVLGEPNPVEGTRTFRSEFLTPGEIPDADAIILNADSHLGAQFASLPKSKGQKFLYFQGYGDIGNPTVIANLRRGYKVISSSRWIADEARRHTQAVSFVPYGLDRTIFNSQGRTQPTATVAMMTHYLAWKGTQDGLEALRRVRSDLNDVRIVLFGVTNPGFEGAEFHGRASRQGVAGILRRSAVFVCPSWEEGFGMPGLEAMACGAALATTDTKGSRDYARHEHAALVSPPRQPDELAQNIIRLLTDTALRDRIAMAGEQTALTYPSWPGAAELFLQATVSSSRAPDFIKE